MKRGTFAPAAAVIPGETAVFLPAAAPSARCGPPCSGRRQGRTTGPPARSGCQAPTGWTDASRAGSPVSGPGRLLSYDGGRNSSFRGERHSGAKSGFIGAITRLRPVATGLRPEKTGLRGVVLPFSPVRAVLMVRPGGSAGAARPVRCRPIPSGPADSLRVAVARRALRVRRTMLPRNGGSGVRAGSGRAAVAGRGPCARRRRRRSSGGR